MDLKKIFFAAALLTFCHFSFSQTSVYVQKENGIFQVPCKVNGISMDFIFDTGASTVSISKTEANFLIKQNLLKPEDFIGVEEYQTANGEIVRGEIINLTTIQINDLVLENVKATIIPTQNAPLLLGQNVISKLGGVEINGNRLTIHSKENTINFENETNSNQYLETKFNEFLGINLTKHPTDFNPELKEHLNFEKNEYIPIPFDMLRIKNFELKSFNFDNKRIAYWPKGQARMVVLLKQFQSKTESQNVFKELKKILSKTYQTPDTNQTQSGTELLKWEFTFYTVYLYINDNNEVGIGFIRSIEDIEKFNRQIFTHWINEITYHPEKEISMFARFENNKLNFYREIKSTFSSEGVERNILKESNYIEGTSDILTKSFIRNVLKNNQVISNLKKCYINELKFTTNFYFIDSSSEEINKTMYWDDFVNLPLPFTESEFDEILN